MRDKPTKTINDFISIETLTFFNRKKVNCYVVCEVIKLSELSGAGTWYNCLDSRGKKVVIFDVFNRGEYGYHSKGKWLARSC